MAKKTAKKKTTKQTPKEVEPKKLTIEDELATLAASIKPAELRFIHLYLGGEEGLCWNNATRAYCVAFEKDYSDPKDVKTSSVLGSRLLGKVEIQKYRACLLRKAGFTEDRIKERYGELAYQNSNIGAALGATDRIAKIAGVLKDDGMKVNIPELTALGENIKQILQGNANPKK